MIYTRCLNNEAPPDALIGRLTQALEDEGLTENTIVVLWSDHGWKLGEFNGWGKMTNYEIDTRVPLIISAPGLSTVGQSTDGLAELLDLFPTLCELAGIDTPEFVDGDSLAPLLIDPQASVKMAAYSQYHRNHDGQQYMGYAIRTSAHRFVEWRNFESGEVTARELYELPSASHDNPAIEACGKSPKDRLRFRAESQRPNRRVLLDACKESTSIN